MRSRIPLWSEILELFIEETQASWGELLDQFLWYFLSMYIQRRRQDLGWTGVVSAPSDLPPFGHD